MNLKDSIDNYKNETVNHEQDEIFCVHIINYVI